MGKVSDSGLPHSNLAPSNRESIVESVLGIELPDFFREYVKWRKFSYFLLRVLLSNFSRFNNVPYKLNFSLSKKCNSRCVNCMNWKEKNESDLSALEIRKVAGTIKNLSWLHISGGEPSERADFVDIVQIFNQQNPQLYFVQFATNGINRKRIVESVKKIVQLEIPKVVVTVSIDGPPQDHDRLRGIRNNFQLAVETFIELKAIPNVEVIVGMTLFQENHGLISQTFNAIQERLKRVGVSFDRKDMRVNLGQNSDLLYKNLNLKIQHNEKTIQEIIKYRKGRSYSFSGIQFLEGIFHKHSIKYIKTGVTPLPCKATRSSIYLAEDGQVYPCMLWSRPLGDIRSSGYSISKVLELSEVNVVRKEIDNKKCINCWSPCEAYQTILGNLI